MSQSKDYRNNRLTVVTSEQSRAASEATTVSAYAAEESAIKECAEKTREHMSFLVAHIGQRAQTLDAINTLKRDHIESLRLWRQTVERETKQAEEAINKLNALISKIDHKKLAELGSALGHIQALSTSPVYSAILKAVEVKS